MSYELKKGYIERNFDSFTQDMGSNESKDILFTYFTLGCLFPEIDKYNVDQDMITDGGEDKQIDCVYLVQEKNEINLIQVKKSNANFSSNIIIQMANGLDWFLNQPEDKVKELNNIKLREKILEAHNLLNWEDGKLNINLYYCNLGDSEKLGKEVLDEVNKLNSEYRKIWPKFNFQLIGIKEYYDLIKRSEIEDIDCEIEITDKNSKIEYDIDEKTRGVVVTTSTIQVAELVKKFGEKLFEQNIRYSLGTRNKVNQKIRETITTDQSDFFWYFNNGITIICNSFSVVNNPNKNIIKLKGLQIVNGCQTSTTLFDAYEKGELKDSYVIVKIFSSSDQKFINKITEATNSQSSINTRDLLANDPLQELIRKNLSEKYFYEHKRNQYKGMKIQEAKKINNEKLGQAVMSIILKQPSKARSNKKLIFTDDYYQKIFDRNIDQLLLCYLIFNFCEKIRNYTTVDLSRESQIIAYGIYHLSLIMGQLLLLDKNNDNLGLLVGKIENDKDFLKQYFDNSVNILNNILHLYEETTKEQIVSFTNLFKNSSTDTFINKNLSNFI